MGPAFTTRGSAALVAMFALIFIGFIAFATRNLVDARLKEAKNFRDKMVGESLVRGYARYALSTKNWKATVAANSTLKSHTLSGSSVSDIFADLAVVDPANNTIIPATGLYLNSALNPVSSQNAAWLVKSEWKGTGNKQVEFALSAFAVKSGLPAMKATSDFQRPADSCQTIGMDMTVSGYWANVVNTCPAGYRLTGGYSTGSATSSRSSDYIIIPNSNSVRCQTIGTSTGDFLFATSNGGILPTPYNTCYARCCWTGGEL